MLKLRRFYKKSIDNQRKLFLIFVSVSGGCALIALLLQLLWGTSSVYRETLYIELNREVRPIVDINTSGMPVDVSLWDGDEIKIEVVSELPLIITEEDYGREITISQDDAFAVSLFTLDLFRYELKVFLPQDVEYKELNITTVNGNIFIEDELFRAYWVSYESQHGTVIRRYGDAFLPPASGRGTFYSPRRLRRHPPQRGRLRGRLRRRPGLPPSGRGDVAKRQGGVN